MDRERPIRILQVLGRLDRGGAETMIMNLYRHMDRSRIQFDFVIHTEEICDYTEEVKRLGGRIYSMERFTPGTALRYRRQWRAFFRAHPEYRIIHGHMRSTAVLYLQEAKRAGLVTIVHSHNTSSGSGFSAVIKNIMQAPLRFQADYLFACSAWAGRWLYGKRACGKSNFRILLNGIDPECFRFDAAVRAGKRRELMSGMTLTSCEPEDAETVENGGNGREREVTVFLHIGRLEEQKNHAFLLRIMREIAALNPRTVLYLCGAGPLEQKIREQIRAYGLEGHVFLLGMRTDVPALMQAADGMLFPSLFEGLPVTLVEAQAAGLPVLMADTVTDEVVLTDLVRTMPLSETPQNWARQALTMAAAGRERYADVIARSGYDVAENARELGRFYEDKS